MRDEVGSRPRQVRHMPPASRAFGALAVARPWLGSATIDDTTKVLGVVQLPDACRDPAVRALVGRRLCLGAADCGCPFHEAARADVPLQARWPSEFAASGLIGRVTVWPVVGAAHGAASAIVIPAGPDAYSSPNEGSAGGQLETAAMLAHELRGPLSTLRNAAELVLAGTLDTDEERQLQQLIMRQVERLDRLTRTLLEAFRLKAGSLDLTVLAVVIAALCEDVIADFENDDGTEIALLRERAPRWLFLDEPKVRTVLVNLIGNALKHSPPGGHILVRVETGDGSVRIAVEDDGPGISASDAARIFDPFYQAAPERLAKRGFGLGLHIARTLVERHGGRIWTENAPGGGAAFVFTLPARGHRHDAEASWRSGVFVFVAACRVLK